MVNKEVLDMTYLEIMSLENGKLKNQYLKSYRIYLTKVVNKLYMKAIHYHDFHFSKDCEELTLKQVINELNEFLEKKLSKEEIKDMIYGSVKK